MTAPVPKQLRVLRALTAHLEGINPTNVDPATGGVYEIDLRDRVYRGRSLLSVRDAAQAVAIWEFPRQDVWAPVGEYGICRMNSWSVMLQGWPEDDPDNPSDPAYELMAKVEMRLARLIKELPNGRGPEFPNEFMLGGELSALTIAPGIVRPPEDAASRLAMFYMPLVLGVKVNVADPYGS